MTLSVSVITAVKKDPIGFKETMLSILAQQAINKLEIIVIDAGDDPETSNAIEQFKDNIDHHILDASPGIANAFNRGIELSTQPYVAILNAGDRWLPSTLELVQDAVDTTDSVIHGPIMMQPTEGEAYLLEPDINKMKFRMSIFHPSWFVPSTFYQQIGRYDTSYTLAMDSEWAHRAMRLGIPFTQVTAPLAIMRLGGRSDTDFVKALNEYRRSAIVNGVSNVLVANIAFAINVLGKSINNVFRIQNHNHSALS